MTLLKDILRNTILKQYFELEPAASHGGRYGVLDGITRESVQAVLLPFKILSAHSTWISLAMTALSATLLFIPSLSICAQSSRLSKMKIYRVFIFFP